MNFNVIGKNLKESDKSSHRKCSVKKLFLKTSQENIDKKILHWSLYLINLEVQLFSGEYCEVFQNTYSEEHLQTAPSEVSGEIAFASISLFYVKI